MSDSEVDLIRYNEDGLDSDSLAGSECDPDSDVESGIPLKDIKGAGRTIARCCDMFCNVNKAVHLVILSKQEEQGDRESKDEDRHQARKEALDRITPQVLAHYKQVYYTLVDEIPSIKALIEDPSHTSMLKTMLKKINEAISETRSNDSARLCEKLPTYILPNPKVDTMKPIINSSTSKSELRLNHVQLAGYLCPIESLKAFNENPEEHKIENGKIDMSATKLPAFLWEDNGTKYNDKNIYSRLFHGFYLERVARHIFTGPSTAHGGDSHAVRSCNAVLHHMDKVEATHITYAAVLAHFRISSQSRWSEKDGLFNYRKFYYITQDVINECEDVKWKEGLLKHYNM
ncbi:hypothetical protein J3R83DRAFT_2845 [Lanmaoa asiatica]|nr:hypothetical protein J3R83DRAFT_2845 [Lanmaoa asiatica]